MPKNNIFISLLKEYTNIDVEFIDTFFKKFNYNILMILIKN